MSKAKNLEEARKAFHIVSQAILVVIEKHLPNSSYARYYCPMVKKYWIQDTSKVTKVHNPYAAKRMPHCGSKI